MTIKSRRLLLFMLLRTSRECYVTAGNIYVVSMENFSAVSSTVVIELLFRKQNFHLKLRIEIFLGYANIIFLLKCITVSALAKEHCLKYDQNENSNVIL